MRTSVCLSRAVHTTGTSKAAATVDFAIDDIRWNLVAAPLANARDARPARFRGYLAATRCPLATRSCLFRKSTTRALSGQILGHSESSPRRTRFHLSLSARAYVNDSQTTPSPCSLPGRRHGYSKTIRHPPDNFSGPKCTLFSNLASLPITYKRAMSRVARHSPAPTPPVELQPMRNPTTNSRPSWSFHGGLRACARPRQEQLDTCIRGSVP